MRIGLPTQPSAASIAASAWQKPGGRPAILTDEQIASCKPVPPTTSVLIGRVLTFPFRLAFALAVPLAIFGKVCGKIESDKIRHEKKLQEIRNDRQWQHPVKEEANPDIPSG